MKLKQTGRNGGYMAAGIEMKRDHCSEGCHTPPGVQQNEIIDFALQTPVYNGGSFSYGGFTIPVQTRFVRPHTLNDAGYADFPTRPIDNETGLPLCFYAISNMPKIVDPNLEGRADWDHQFTKVATKYGLNPILELPGARYGLMHLRIQWATIDDHHNKWNKYKYIAPPQPGTPEQMAATMAFGLAGYIPRLGLRLRREKFFRTVLSEGKRRQMLLEGQVRTQYDEEILTYLQWYVVNQSVDHIKESQLDEFVSTKKPERRLTLGVEVARLLMERAAEPINPTYVKARGQDLLYIRSKDKEVKPPDSATDFLHLKLATEKRVHELVAHTLRAVRVSLAA